MQSTADLESPNAVYLSDFLYIDTIRLAHYYGQLSSHGLITQSKRLSKATSKEADTVGVRAMVTGLRQAENANEETVEHQIDPAFSRPQDTLDALYDAGYIDNGLTEAGIGTLFMTKGAISMFDVRMLKDMWSSLGELVAEAQVAGIPPGQKAKAKLAAKQEYSAIAPLIEKLPHSLQGNINSTEGPVAWFTVKPEFMLVNPEDLAFKHGSDIPGEWHMLGVLDAKPYDLIQESEQRASESSGIETVMREMLSVLRTLFGRPQDRFGVTPVLIFRTMKKADTAED